MNRTRRLPRLALAAILSACGAGSAENDEAVDSVRLAVCNDNGSCEPEQGEDSNGCGDCYCYEDGYCDAPAEDCKSCPADCGACPPPPAVCNWDGNCEPSRGENGDNCISDCWGCGDGACDETTETCSSCSGDCGPCGGGASCGDGTCDLAGGEDCWQCPGDCPTCCGDSVCDGSVGENPSTCPVDCRSGGGTSFCGDGNCDADESTSSCPKDCTGSGGNQSCCADATDPCGWNGDGVCDEGCAWGTDQDCGPSSGGCCGDAADPCGWNGDGICNQGCAWGDDPDCMGGSGGSGGGTPVACNGACTCGGGDPPGAALDVGFEKKWEDIGIGCPVVGGKMGVDVTLEGSASYEPALCPEYESEVSVGAELGLSVELCKSYEFSVAGGGDFHARRTYGKTCNEATCTWERQDGYCGEKGFSGFASMGLSRFFGFKKRWRSPGRGIRPTVSLLMSCGVTVGGSIKVSGAYDGVDQGGLDPCPDCTKAKGSIELGVQGIGGCGIKATVGRFSKSFGCRDCAQIDLTATGGAETTQGACGNQDCAFLTLGARAAVLPPCIPIGYGWFKIGVKCQASVGATKEFNSCGSKPLQPEDVKFGCNVVGKGRKACG